MDAKAPGRIVLAASLALSGALVAPALRGAYRDPALREAWRSGLLVVDPLVPARMAAMGYGKVVFLDIREEEEHAEYRIPGSRLARPHLLLEADLSDLMDADLVIPHCNKDLRGFEAARILQRRGVPNVALLDGFGLTAWSAAGLPIVGSWNGWTDEQGLWALQGMDLEGKRSR